MAHPGAEDLRKQVLDWLTGLNLWDEVEPSEDAVLRTPLGQLQARDVLQAVWNMEGLAILAWALRRLDFPKHEKQVEPYVAADAVWFFDASAESVIASAELRSQTELQACRELLYAIHCRPTDYRRNKTQLDFTHWVEQEWLNALNLNVAKLIVDNDLAIHGKAISEVTEERLKELLSITLERHRAIIWLVEGHSSYSKTPVDI